MPILLESRLDWPDCGVRRNGSPRPSVVIAFVDLRLAGSFSIEDTFAMKAIVLPGMVFLSFVLFFCADGKAQLPQTQPAPAAATTGQLPFPPLTGEQQQFLDQVLKIWEQRSQAVQRYRCSFKRWEYDPVFGPRQTFKTYSEGEINYAQPDKGSFQVTKTMHWTPPAAEGQQPTYAERPGEVGEHWICDGTSVFEHDQQKKQLIQRELPPHMRGKAIAEGPLPFLFGAEAEKIKQRFWIRPLALPEGVQGEYWLEAYPKTRQDAANYQKVHVIISQTDFLPKGLVIFDRNFDPVRNPARITFTFDDREYNWNTLLSDLNVFKAKFFEPKVPFGWKKVIEKYQAPPGAEGYAPATAARPDSDTTR